MTKFFSWHWDLLGFGASFLCALHCMIWPLLFSLGIFAGAHWLLNPIVEWIFIGTSMVIAIWALQSSFFKKHHKIGPTLIALLGFAGLLFALLDIVPNPHGFMAIGGGLIAYAHFYNWQLANRGRNHEKQTRYWLNPSRIIIIVLLLLYFRGLHSAFQNDHRPPDKEAVLKAVWQRVED
ncbi:MAG: MerC domain-containing protein [Bacteroidota bacterium]